MDMLFTKPTIKVEENDSLNEVVHNAKNALEEMNMKEEAMAMKVGAYGFSSYLNLKSFLEAYVNIEEKGKSNE